MPPFTAALVNEPYDSAGSAGGEVSTLAVLLALEGTLVADVVGEQLAVAVALAVDHAGVVATRRG